MTSGAIKYGQSDFASVDRARENFVGAAFNGLSMCCTPIEILSNDGADTMLATATGFYWRHEERSFLVSNWHVFSGRNVFTNELISENGLVPQRLAFHGMTVQVANGLITFERRKYRWTLSDEAVELISNPPRIDDVAVDLWAMPLPDGVVLGRDASRTGFAGAAVMSCFVNENIGRPIVTRAGDDCFILGYPLRNYEGLMSPVWKRGSVASDTNIGVENKPIFLVDAATTSSMSGSPIIRKATTFTADNRDIGALQEFVAFDLIGIYAGRLQRSDLMATNLGYAWYKTLINRVISRYTFEFLGQPIRDVEQ